MLPDVELEHPYEKWRREYEANLESIGGIENLIEIQKYRAQKWRELVVNRKDEVMS